MRFTLSGVSSAFAVGITFAFALDTAFDGRVWATFVEMALCALNLAALFTLGRARD